MRKLRGLHVGAHPGGRVRALAHTETYRAPEPAHLRRLATSAWATEEQYDLFRAYLDQRHADGGMADMDIFEFAAMIEETPVRTRVVEYRSADPAAPSSDRLVAVCLIDVLDDGLGAVYLL